MPQEIIFSNNSQCKKGLLVAKYSGLLLKGEGEVKKYRGPGKNNFRKRLYGNIMGLQETFRRGPLKFWKIDYYSEDFHIFMTLLFREF